MVAAGPGLCGRLGLLVVGAMLTEAVSSLLLNWNVSQEIYWAMRAIVRAFDVDPDFDLLVMVVSLLGFIWGAAFRWAQEDS